MNSSLLSLGSSSKLSQSVTSSRLQDVKYQDRTHDNFLDAVGLHVKCSIEHWQCSRKQSDPLPITYSWFPIVLAARNRPIENFSSDKWVKFRGYWQLPTIVQQSEGLEGTTWSIRDLPIGGKSAKGGLQTENRQIIRKTESSPSVTPVTNLFQKISVPTHPASISVSF